MILLLANHFFKEEGKGRMAEWSKAPHSEWRVWIRVALFTFFFQFVEINLSFPH